MKKFYIIHGWDGSPSEPMLAWIGEQLKRKGYEVHLPSMPDPGVPVIEAWVSRLIEIAGTPDSESYFIGHSMGCQTIMRFLETLPLETKVGGAVFIAGWLKLENLENDEVTAIAKPWLETSIDFEKVKSICPNLKVFLSDNEPFGCVEENKKIFEEKLQADVVVLHNKGHFTKDDGVTELPEALNAILKTTNPL